uniref:DUF1640 domain-containing protein n=1 Tax=Candidatus Kentrum sp. FM TaxID=2126340 RepID=A0A450SLB1_9GAMM|nr:MAG: hypothetical protein BECKFM1743C_GA0114222_101333 [Candidatus Kentron sp. FM]VFJ54401.1 MAG: hypothetical protein BECKFM1743A_GA0114220_101312 [Candidatus Kentron sp. FM]VFK10861.1 MAG: hypothetical protein BECKFM1743B_GA0114221_101583 [Candidatus Kentron sp. FM]
MTTMVVELYDALKEAGTSEESAKKAAGVMADYDNRFESRFDSMDRELSDIKGEMKLHRWMLALIILAEVAPFLGKFF